MERRPAIFRNTTEHDLLAAQAYLNQIFGNGPAETPRNFQQDVLAWKYVAPHPWWPEGRSYRLETADGAIAAHGAMMPVRYLLPNGSIVESGQVIDWAAGAVVPGAGMLVYRHCIQKGGGTLLAIGGSADTQKLIPQVKWFKAKDDMQHFARPLRPWKYWSGWSPRSLARLGRALQWKYLPPLPSSGRWTCRLGDDAVFQPPATGYIPILRSREWFQYLKKCPVVPSDTYVLERDGKPEGHAFVALNSGSARVADFVALREPVQAFAALVRCLASREDVGEVVASSSLQELAHVFTACGLRWRNNSKVWVADPKKQVDEGARWEVNALIGDAYYLHDPARPFLC